MAAPRGHGIAAVFAVALAFASMPAVAAHPTSARAEDAAARVRPHLERDLARAGLRYGAPVFLRITKRERELEVWIERGGRYARFRTYPICAFSGEPGPKMRQGDGQAPEGFYRVAAGQLNPLSRFHLSFDLGYPNAYDRAHGRTGSALMVHGNCVSIGCYAMGDEAIEQIYTLVDAALRDGQPAVPVHVFPFRMSEEALRLNAASPHLAFWRDLQQGWDYFEREHQPPPVGVRDGRYVLSAH